MVIVVQVLKLDIVLIGERQVAIVFKTDHSVAGWASGGLADNKSAGAQALQKVQGSTHSLYRCGAKLEIVLHQIWLH
jgi:hypothetical protein